MDEDEQEENEVHMYIVCKHQSGIHKEEYKRIHNIAFKRYT